MHIQLNNIIPIPLSNRASLTTSNIWGNQINFATPQHIKIVAPSGTGKTTLIQSIYGLRTDYSGTITYNNININKISPTNMATFRQQKISVIFQDLQLFTQLTAFENIELKRILQTPYYQQSKIGTMAEQLGVSHILNNKLATCSYGERQRIAIIRALIQPFQILLMDEPFSHIDHANTQKAVALIAQECAQRNAGFVLCDLDNDTHFNYHTSYTL